MTIRGLIRRWMADPVTALATIVTVGLSMILLAAGPIYSDAVAVAALRQSVTASVADTGIAVEVRADPAVYDELDDLATTAIAAAVRPLDTEISGAIRSGESFGFGPARAGGQVDLATFVSIENFDEHAVLIAGDWPADGSEAHAVAIDARAAELLGLSVGDTFTASPRSGSAADAEVTIVGLYELADDFDPFWTGRDFVVEVVTETESFRNVFFVTTEMAMLSGLSERTDASWRAFPEFDDLEPDDVDTIRRRVRGLQERLNSSVGSDEAELASISEIEVATSVPALLARSGRSLTVARSAVLAVVLQLALLAGYALVLVAGLSVDARRSESAMMRARGAGSLQLLGSAVVEALLLVVPMALIAPQLAAWALRGLDEFGPLASIDLAIDPRPMRDASIAVAIAAVVIVVLLSVPAYRSARAAEHEGHRHRRQRLSSNAQRAGLDVALVFVSALAFWQLSTLGDERAASVRGRFGIDPLVIVAPTFGLIAGSFLAIRLVPLMARLAERRLPRSRSLVPALSSWQFARRPARYGRSALLLIMAVAIGTFAVTYEATWLRSQGDQADHRVGTDARVTPNRRTNDSVSDLLLVGLHEQLPEVTRSMPVSINEAQLPGSDDDARLLAIDAARATFPTSRPSTEEQLENGLAELLHHRPSIPAVELPGRPTSLDLEIVITDGGHGEDTAGPPFAGLVVVWLQDGFGMLHEVDLGAAGPETGLAPFDLTTESADGTVIRPEYPLSIVGMEIRTSAPPPPSRDVAIELGPLRLIDADGTRQQVDLGGSQLVSSVETLGFLGEPATIDLSAAQPELGISLAVETGSATGPVPLIYRFVPAPTAPPPDIAVLVTRSWMEVSRTAIGDVVGVSVSRGEPTPIRIVGIVDTVPTIDPSSRSGILVDLPSLQMATYSTGHTVGDVSEHWLDATGDVPELALLAAPIEAVEVVVRENERAALVSNPPALGSIGALTLGFIASAMFALVGLVGTTVVSARDRRLEFALLRALGLTMRQLRAWMLVEQVTIVAVGVALGTGIGLGLSALVLPLVSLGQQGGEVVPGVVVTFPWTTIALLQVSLVAGLVVGLTVVNLMTRRMVVATTLRAGSEL